VCWYVSVIAHVYVCNLSVGIHVYARAHTPRALGYYEQLHAFAVLRMQSLSKYRPCPNIGFSVSFCVCLQSMHVLMTPLCTLLCTIETGFEWHGKHPDVGRVPPEPSLAGVGRVPPEPSLAGVGRVPPEPSLAGVGRVPPEPSLPLVQSRRHDALASLIYKQCSSL
jgi:hypothetical protein